MALISEFELSLSLRQRPSKCPRWVAIATALSVVAGAAMSQPASVAPVAAPKAVAAVSTTMIHPWQAAIPRLNVESYFVNLKDGEKIETPYLVKFGLSGGWGLAPISVPARAKSGHHHMLIDQPLPIDLGTPLPFTAQYIHFGKGQMESVLTLPPGQHTLRMLLANQQHQLHFVYSKPVTITVIAANNVDPKTLVQKGLSIGLAGTEARPPFRVQFHASGLNVAHISQQIPDTGHFRLRVIPQSGAKAAEMDFIEGQTEVYLEPPAGDYTLRLDFVDNVNPEKVLVPGVSKPFKVL